MSLVTVLEITKEAEKRPYKVGQNIKFFYLTYSLLRLHPIIFLGDWQVTLGQERRDGKVFPSHPIPSHFILSEYIPYHTILSHQNPSYSIQPIKLKQIKYNFIRSEYHTIQYQPIWDQTIIYQTVTYKTLSSHTKRNYFSQEFERVDRESQGQAPVWGLVSGSYGNFLYIFHSLNYFTHTKNYLAYGRNWISQAVQIEVPTPKKS